jgi:hypothetical protein
VHELAPGRFSWRKYPEQINIELVRVYLSCAKDSQHGELLLGSGRTGWTLTKAGLEWAEEVGRRFVGRDLTRHREQLKSGSIDESRWHRERARIQSTAAWIHWCAQGQEPSRREAAEVFRIDSYAESEERIKVMKINRLRSMFDEDQAIRPFLNHLVELLEQPEELR